MVVTPMSAKPTEETLIDALRGCQGVHELKMLEQRLAALEDVPPLFDWICNLLVQRRLSRILAAKLLLQLHQS